MLMKKKIMIDAGHGGTDPGAVNGSRKEKDDTLRLALAVGGYLSSNYDVKVYYTRKVDEFQSLISRTSYANGVNADLFVSFHRNSVDSGDANGYESLICAKGGKAEVQAELFCKSMSMFKNRGVKVRPEIAVLKNTKMPAVLCEVGFISNSHDNMLFDRLFVRIVNALCSDIAICMNLKPLNFSCDWKIGDIVNIKKGAVYSGADAGKPVSKYALDRSHTISYISNGKALLKEINSWIECKYLMRD